MFSIHGGTIARTTKWNALASAVQCSQGAYKPCPHMYPPRLPSSMSRPVRIICRQRHPKPQEPMW